LSWPERFRRRRFPFFDPDFPSSWFYRDIDDLMREMEKKMEEAFGRMPEKLPPGLTKERKLPDGSTLKEWGPFVYGYSVTIGPDGKPRIQEFGNVKPGTKGRAQPLDIIEKREPLLDLIDQGQEMRVVAELPGVPKEAIKIHVSENSLSIQADHGDHRYSKDLELPDEIDPTTARSTYNNGVLEVVLTKKKKSRPKGVEVKID